MRLLTITSIVRSRNTYLLALERVLLAADEGGLVYRVSTHGKRQRDERGTHKGLALRVQEGIAVRLWFKRDFRQEKKCRTTSFQPNLYEPEKPSAQETLITLSCEQGSMSGRWRFMLKKVAGKE